MRKPLALLALCATSSFGMASLLGPSSYFSFADSPFFSATFDYFFLEDAEDGLANTPGATYNYSSLSSAFGTSYIDSVDEDDGTLDGNGNGGEALWGAGFFEVSFDAGVLGQLPTHAGLVWTDGLDDITFEAFDENGASLGTLVGTHADGDFTGGTAEDRFYGVVYSGGISKLQISNPSGIEVDHVQYGAVPEPASMALLGLGLAAVARRKRA